MDLIDPFAIATPRFATRLKSGEPHQVFSGFLYHVEGDRYIVLTALHCLLRPNTFYFKNRGTEPTWSETYGHDLDCEALGFSVPLYDGTTPLFRWHQDTHNASIDVAGVPVRLPSRPPAINMPGTWGDYDVVTQGLPLTAGSAGLIYGFPGGAAILRSAPIARGFTLATDYRLNPFAFHVDGIGGAGCSGGPVALRAERGDRTLLQWIGIYVATHEAERLGRCIPLPQVMELVETMTAELDLWA
ncbi:hypothetical protein [Phenylobacterium sp. Root700]|uniref:hypothetical protein n=1 Tax=Phenylobacterium sp. Root700 TaxID=1736591 RepID=UPI0006F3A13D|nr:hypothetical protein [Phenylobacterium sp. Root700]KRB46644.1 hypothetical protein ASE02_19410 [Phenylobacterium sp. Root700]